MSVYIEKRLDLTVRLFKEGNFEVDVYQPECGECIQIPGEIFEYGEHPEFDTAIGEEICSWIALMADEPDENWYGEEE